MGQTTLSAPLQPKTDRLGYTVGTSVYHSIFCITSSMGRRVAATVGESDVTGTARSMVPAAKFP
jgi:hypothetical protein